MLRSHSDDERNSGMHDACICSPSPNAAKPHVPPGHSASERIQRQETRRSQLISIGCHKRFVDLRLLQLIVVFSMFICTQGLILTTGQSSVSVLRSTGAFVGPVRMPVRASTLKMDLEDSFDTWGVSSDTQTSLFDEVVYQRVTRPVMHVTSSVPTTAKPPRGSAIRSRGRTERLVPPASALTHRGIISSTASTRSSSSGGISTRSSSQLGSSSASLLAQSYHQLYSREQLLAALSSSRGRPTVLLFASKSCRTCRRMQPKIERAAMEAGADFLFVHHDTSTDALFREHDVRLTPTVQVYDAVATLVDKHVCSTADLPHLSGVLESVAFGI